MWHHKFIASYGNDTEVPGSHGQLKTCWKKCPFSRRKHWGCDDFHLTADCKLLLTVWVEMPKAIAVAILVDRTVSRTDKRREQMGWCWPMCWRTQYVQWLIANAEIWVMAGKIYDMVHYTLVWWVSSVLFARYWSFFALCRIAGCYNSQVGNPRSSTLIVLVICLSISWRILCKPRMW